MAFIVLLMAAALENVGLKESRAIARIAVHPAKPEVAYVAALGHLWKDGGERGLYKTTDGGKTWKLVLQAPAPNDVKNRLRRCCARSVESGNRLRHSLCAAAHAVVIYLRNDGDQRQ